MDKGTTMNIRHEALTRLQGSLQEELIPAEIVTQDGVEVLSVIFAELGLDGEGAVGELFFLPFRSDDDTVQHFSCVITIADEISLDDPVMLYEAMSYINFRLPCGSYSYDKDAGSLVYKLSVPIPADMTEDELLNEMNICSGNAVAEADMHMDLLLGLLDGEVSMEDIKRSFTG